jgi:hypothetical protein
MRALCGAIIAAGGLIGLGLTALAFGIRYQGFHEINPKTEAQIGAVSLTYSMVIIIVGLAAGLAVAFIGLMYHHERRHRELSREPGHLPGTRATV